MCEFFLVKLRNYSRKYAFTYFVFIQLIVIQKKLNREYMSTNLSESFENLQLKGIEQMSNKNVSFFISYYLLILL